MPLTQDQIDAANNKVQIALEGAYFAMRENVFPHDDVKNIKKEKAVGVFHALATEWLLDKDGGILKVDEIEFYKSADGGRVLDNIIFSFFDGKLKQEQGVVDSNIQAGAEGTHGSSSAGIGKN